MSSLTEDIIAENSPERQLECPYYLERSYSVCSE